MKNLILSAILFLVGVSTTVNAASYMYCNGTDTAGQNVYLIAYSNSSVVNINGDILSIVGLTRNGQGVVTENFISVSGVLVYDSIVPINDDSLTIYQFNAVTNKLLAQAWLVCSFYEYYGVKESVFEHPLLKAIKEKAGTMPFSRAESEKDQNSNVLNSAIGTSIANIAK